MAQEPNNDIVKVDLDKSSSEDFKITTMEDDLEQASSKPESASFVTKKEETALENEPIKNIPSHLPPQPPDASSTPEFLLEDEPKGGRIKSFLIGFLFVFVLGAIGLGVWWYIAHRQPLVQGPTPTTPTPPSFISDTPLISIDKSIVLELGEDETRKSFLEKLSALVAQEKQGKALLDGIARVILAKENKLLTLTELGSISGIDFSPFTKSEKFTLLVSLRFDEDADIFGIVIKADAPDVQQALSSKEIDISSLAAEFYAEYSGKELPQAASENFFENTYGGVVIRYMNFDTAGRSFDYALTRDLLLLAGSKNMMFSMIDRAKLQEINGSESQPAAESSENEI